MLSLKLGGQVNGNAERRHASAALLTTNRGPEVETGFCNEAGKSCNHI